MKQLLIFCIGFLTMTSFANAGVVNGGGGTTIKPLGSNYRILWDLYENNPQLLDNEQGDQITILTDPAYPIANDPVYVDYRAFKSYSQLKNKLQALAAKAPNFVSAVADRFGLNVVNGRLQPQNDSHFKYETMQMGFLGVELSMPQIFEMWVPQKLQNKGILGIPTAVFDPATGHAFINIDLWNATGALSQQALLLKERLRKIQYETRLKNKDLQAIVYWVISSDVDAKMPAGFDDNMFTDAWIKQHPPLSPAGQEAPLFDNLGASLADLFYECEESHEINSFACIAVSKLFGRIAQTLVQARLGQMISDTDDTEIPSEISNGLLCRSAPVDLPVRTTGDNN